jgi:D-glycero-D-manno-heptose 1,7-bisphosphate phosphatase
MGVSGLSSPQKSRAVFLDRDGVINHAVVRDGKPYPPSDLGELKITAGTESALQDLKKRGLKLIVVTNQPDVSRGLQTQAMVETINQALRASLPLDDIFVCYHSDEDHCDCRKPSPGMLLDAAKKHNIDLANSYLVGDRWRDIDAGHDAGCKTILVDSGYNERAPAHPPEARVGSLREAADWILQSSLKEPVDEVRV